MPKTPPQNTKCPHCWIQWDKWIWRFIKLGNCWKWKWTQAWLYQLSHMNCTLKKFNEIPLQKNELLKPYTRENITLVGVLKTNVKYKGQQPLLLDLYVIKGQGPCVNGEGLALQDMLRLVCNQISERFTSYTTCQRASGHHDHQPLTSIFHLRKSIPIVTTAQLQH